MNKDKEFKAVEALLRGKVKQPSPAFEEALRQIPQQSLPAGTASPWAGIFKVAGIAAAITLLAWAGMDLNINDNIQSPERILQSDQDLLTLFSLSNELDMAAPLLSEENLVALDYLTSTP